MNRLLRITGIVACLLMITSCDTFMTKKPTAGDDFESPFDNLDRDLNALFLEGDENFEHVFTFEEGLGPIFNNTACGSCHPGDGRGTPELGFFRFGSDPDLAMHLGGPQHQDKAIPGVPLEIVPNNVERSFRLPLPVFGVGLIEHIPEATIMAHADPNDDDGDGISGRPNMVFPPEYVPEAYVGGGPGPVLGRFSRKAQISSLLQQTVEAYHEDMGITSDFAPVENLHPQSGSIATLDQVPDPEIPASTVLETVVYIRLLQPPARGKITTEVLTGEKMFNDIGCASCHIPTMQTGRSPIAALDRADVHLYSDLLLHDMGPDLADHRADGDATGSEWRTTPLWGSRLIPEFLDGNEFYMHDGRATSVHDAIMIHGGESQASRNTYAGLSQSDQDALIAFIKSL